METVRHGYDLFFAAFLYPAQLGALNHVVGWQERAKTKICFLGEVWRRQFADPIARRRLSVLRQFDYVFLHTAGSADLLSDLLGKPCHVLPIGVDALRFWPGSPAPARPVDVFSMGRRSEATHRALVSLSEQGRIFYLHDTAAGFDVLHPREHRLLLAATIKRSRYFISYHHNANITSITGGQEELGARLFEGTAGGSILLGSAPATEAFRRHFDWEDAIVEIPFEPSDMAEVLTALDAQPERMARARAHNVRNALLRHDFVHRWAEMMRVADLAEGAGVDARRRAVQAAAAQIPVP